nr:MAG TPA: hypothetical protein [Caudoviricetes sp.]
MKSCNEMKELRQQKHSQQYAELLKYIETKIFNNLTDRYIFINEDETLSKNVKFTDSNWINLLENAGYTVDDRSNFTVPTVKISGW